MTVEQESYIEESLNKKYSNTTYKISTNILKKKHLFMY
ncbi:hypothetical protein [Rickettsia conorii]